MPTKDTPEPEETPKTPRETVTHERVEHTHAEVSRPRQQETEEEVEPHPQPDDGMDSPLVPVEEEEVPKAEHRKD